MASVLCPYSKVSKRVFRECTQVPPYLNQNERKRKFMFRFEHSIILYFGVVLFIRECRDTRSNIQDNYEFISNFSDVYIYIIDH